MNFFSINVYLIFLGPPEIVQDKSNIYTLKGQKNDNKISSLWVQFILCFSCYSNIKSVLRTKLGESGLACVHGLRFGTMAWVIVAHSTFFSGEFLTNKIGVFIVSQSVLAQPLANAQLSVDSFFFIR